MDPMQPLQPLQPNQQPAQPPVQNTNTHNDPTSLESFIRQSAAPQQPVQQSTVPNPSLFQGSGSQYQVVEKVVYKKQRVHGFFRTLTILALVVIGFLMLLESLKVFSLNINGLNLNIIYPVFIILSSVVIWSYKGLFGKIFGLLLFLIIVGGFFVIGVYTSLNPSVQTKFGSYISYTSSPSAQYSKLYINTLISDLTLVGRETNNFLEGNYGSDRKLMILSGAENNYQYYSITEDTNLNLLQSYYSVLSFGITSKQSLYLYVKNLFAVQKIDLTQTLASSLKINAGAIMSDITVGSSLKNLDIESALADITVHLPKDVGVKLNYRHLVGQLELSNFEQKGPGYFESTNIATAQKIINVNIKFGGARTKIVWGK